MDKFEEELDKATGRYVKAEFPEFTTMSVGAKENMTTTIREIHKHAQALCSVHLKHTLLGLNAQLDRNIDSEVIDWVLSEIAYIFTANIDTTGVPSIRWDLGTEDGGLEDCPTIIAESLRCTCQFKVETVRGLCPRLMEICNGNSNLTREEVDAAITILIDNLRLAHGLNKGLYLNVVSLLNGNIKYKETQWRFAIGGKGREYSLSHQNMQKLAYILYKVGEPGCGIKLDKYFRNDYKLQYPTKPSFIRRLFNK